MRILLITAHPDDEVGAFGGSFLKYQAQGVETYVICLTPGQAATHRGNARDDAELSEMRRQEFAASCALLKVTRGWVLDYWDGALERTEFTAVVHDLVGRIREIRPQVMLAQGPEGAITGHRDHAMASLFATAAFHQAGHLTSSRDRQGRELAPHRVQKLYYSTSDFTLPNRPPVSLAPVSCRIDINGYLEKKIQAFHQHHTQSPLFEMFDRAVRQRGNTELFHLVATSSPSILQQETDLFAGVAP